MKRFCFLYLYRMLPGLCVRLIRSMLHVTIYHTNNIYIGMNTLVPTMLSILFRKYRLSANSNIFGDGNFWIDEIYINHLKLSWAHSKYVSQWLTIERLILTNVEVYSCKFRIIRYGNFWMRETDKNIFVFVSLSKL